MFSPRFFSLLLVSPALGIIHIDADDEAATTEIAPSGDFLNSGWQYQVEYSGANLSREHLGTMISPKHFITAVHISAGDTEAIQPMYFNGTGEKVYTIRGGRKIIRYLDDQGNTDPADDTMENTDLAVFEIWETFDDYAELYSRQDEFDTTFPFNDNQQFVMMGRGDGRGNEVTVAGTVRGWGPNTASRRARWGTNTVDGSLRSSAGDLLFAGFDELRSEDRTEFECQGANVDSGGAWFIQDGLTWKLAGINFSVDTFAMGVNGDGQRLAIYEAGGLYLPQASGVNILIPNAGSSNDPQNLLFYRKAHTYASRVSVHTDAINAVIQPAIARAALPAPSRFAGWVEDFGAPAGQVPEGDLDLDGLSNLEEYLTESDPTESDIRVSPLSVEFLPSGIVNLTLTESLDIVGREITTVIESSSDLDFWDPVTDTEEISNTKSNVTGRRIRVLEHTPIIGAEMDFYYRLRVTLATES